MIVDTSAFIAVIRSETTADQIYLRLATGGPHLMSAPTFVEVTTVLRAEQTIERITTLLGRLDITPVPLTVDQARIAAQAYRDYGKGSGSEARLNLGDTFSYALAKEADQPLLFVGDDFTHTDITPALES